MAELIITPRLRLREWIEEDYQPFAEMSASSAVSQFLLPFSSRAESDAWIDRQRARHAESGLAFWAVEDRQSHEFIGAVGLLHIHYEAHFTPAVEVGWRLACAHWGKGYATEAARAALEYGFVERGLSEIVAITVPANEPSRNVMRRIGMVRSASEDFDHPLVPDGHPLRRHVLYRLLRRNWLEQSSRS